MSGRHEQEMHTPTEVTDPGTCPNCDAPLAGVVGREQRGGVERAGCPSCALQLVRRGGGRWEGIRG